MEPFKCDRKHYQKMGPSTIHLYQFSCSYTVHSVAQTKTLFRPFLFIDMWIQRFARLLHQSFYSHRSVNKSPFEDSNSKT